LERPAAEAGIAMLARGGDFADDVIRHEADHAKCDRLVTSDTFGPTKLSFCELGHQGDQGFGRPRTFQALSRRSRCQRS
jgi:hypothetical protein